MIITQIALPIWHLRISLRQLMPLVAYLYYFFSSAQLIGVDRLRRLVFWVHLGSTQITDATVTELKKALPNCTIVGP